MTNGGRVTAVPPLLSIVLLSMSVTSTKRDIVHQAHSTNTAGHPLTTGHLSVADNTGILTLINICY